jgi:hypothetical protein
MQSSTRKRNKFFNSFPPLTFSSEEMLQKFLFLLRVRELRLYFFRFFFSSSGSGLKINKTHWFGRKNPLFALNQLNCFHIHSGEIQKKKLLTTIRERRKAVCMVSMGALISDNVYP